MAKQGKNRSRKGRNRNAKQAFVKKVSKRLVRSLQSFCDLTDYNSVKRWMRGMNGCTNKYVDNGQSFLDIMTRSLHQTGDQQLMHKFAALQATHRAKKAAVKARYAESMQRARERINATTKPNDVVVENPGTAVLKSIKDKPTERALSPGYRIDVYYGKTDNGPGNNEYGCVVVETCEQTLNHCRKEGLYCPRVGSRYKILNEVKEDKVKQICGGAMSLSTGFVSSAIKEQVLEYCKQHPETKSGFNYDIFPHAMR